MYFEGSEKKLEIVVDEQKTTSLLLRPESFWEALVEKSRAQILSSVHSDQCHAFLLSESSLFIWSDRLTMITCGQTTLVDAAEMFVQEFGKESLRALIYERKNEQFPHRQITDFLYDAKRLKHLVGGEAMRFGGVDEHHLYLFEASQKSYCPPREDVTLEVLMYDLQDETRQLFARTDLTAQDIRNITGIDRIFSNFTVDDYVFKPNGYSLNAIRGSDYYTIHVTPQEPGSYVSFETNVHLGSSYTSLIEQVIEIFKPKRFDTILFHPKAAPPFTIPGFLQKSVICEKLSSGYETSYSHFYLPSDEPQRAYRFMEEI